ncbi:hypothetical protein C0989_000743 [Termitomyces sp. Mn162]|nr:hypothetical protein C0989_000743 [Termitomyces sp. Mn162]
MPEQGWDQAWVVEQMGEGWQGRVLERIERAEGGGSAGCPLMKVGPLWGDWREGAFMVHDKDKQKAFPLLEMGLSKQAQGEQAMAGPPGPVVYSPISGAPIEQSTGELWSATEAFLQHQVEGLEKLLATHKEEICRIGEDWDTMQREWDEAQRKQNEAQRDRNIAQRDQDLAIGTVLEWLVQLQQVQAHLKQLEAWVEEG